MIRSLFFGMFCTTALMAAQENLLAPPAPFADGKKPAASIAGGVDFGATTIRELFWDLDGIF